MATAHCLLSTALPNSSVPNETPNPILLSEPSASISTSTTPMPTINLTTVSTLISTQTPSTANTSTPAIISKQPPNQPPARLARVAPTQADFLVPMNMIEHNLAVANLMSGGSLQAEAEQFINARKLSFNRALS